MPAAVEVYADVACPFAWVLLDQLKARREALGAGDVPILVRAWPLEKLNGALPGVGRIADEVRALTETVAPDRFAGFDPTRFPTSTIGAMALTAAAYGRASDAGETVAFRLRELLFEEGVDVGDPVVLGALEASLRSHVTPDPSLVDAEYELGRHRGVKGSPHVFAGEVSEFCPTFTVQEDRGHLTVRSTPWADDFLDACFTPVPE